MKRIFFVEIVYAKVRKVPIIPCIMKEGFEPRGDLGFIRGDLIPIDLFDETKLKENFHKLTKAIDHYQIKSNIQQGKENLFCS